MMLKLSIPILVLATETNCAYNQQTPMGAAPLPEAETPWIDPMDSSFQRAAKKMAGELCRAKAEWLQSRTNGPMANAATVPGQELSGAQRRSPREIASATICEISMGRPVSSIIAQNSFVYLLVILELMRNSQDFKTEAKAANARRWFGTINRWIEQQLEMRVMDFCDLYKSCNDIPSVLFYLRARSGRLNISLQAAFIEFITVCMKLSKRGSLSGPDTINTEDISFFAELTSTYISACHREQREAARKAVAMAIVRCALSTECPHILECFDQFNFNCKLVTVLDSIEQFPWLPSDFMPCLVRYLKTQNAPEDTLVRLCERYYYGSSGSLGRRRDLYVHSRKLGKELPAAIAARLELETAQWIASRARHTNPAQRAPVAQNGQAARKSKNPLVRVRATSGY
ncbi:hypothetical protein PAPHI01_1933 [Pancytospora philotis]|nr:hypothetical protein PAPHI01_1933 [Pancytospora philotis]